MFPKFFRTLTLDNAVADLVRAANQLDLVIEAEAAEIEKQKAIIQRAEFAAADATARKARATRISVRLADLLS